MALLRQQLSASGASLADTKIGVASVASGWLSSEAAVALIDEARNEGRTAAVLLVEREAGLREAVERLYSDLYGVSSSAAAHLIDARRRTGQ